MPDRPHSDPTDEELLQYLDALEDRFNELDSTLGEEDGLPGSLGLKLDEAMVGFRQARKLLKRLSDQDH